MFHCTVIVSIGLKAALLLSTTSTGCLGENDSLPKFHGDFLGMASGNSFSFKTKLEKPKEGLQFAFILVRHGMVPPCYESFELDINRHKFGSTWKPETATKRGNQLMNMIGRSLKTRYNTYLDKLTWDEISVTTIDQDWTVTNAEHLLQGLLRNTKHNKVLEGQQKGEPSNTRIISDRTEVNYDRFNLATKPCLWFNKIMTELNLELSVPGNVVALRYCTKTFYEELRKFVITDNIANKHTMWWIESPKQVFALWQLLWFEVQEGETLSAFPKCNWSKILATVFEYSRLQLDWHPDVAPLLVGRMFNKIKEEKNENKNKFHIHISDGTTITNFMWNLPGNPRTLWLDYGDALILGFYEDESVSVSLFSGMAETHQTIDTYKYEDLKYYFTEKGLDLTMDEYQQICDFNPEV